MQAPLTEALQRLQTHPGVEQPLPFHGVFNSILHSLQLLRMKHHEQVHAMCVPVVLSGHSTMAGACMQNASMRM